MKPSALFRKFANSVFQIKFETSQCNIIATSQLLVRCGIIYTMWFYQAIVGIYIFYVYSIQDILYLQCIGQANYAAALAFMIYKCPEFWEQGGIKQNLIFVVINLFAFLYF